MREVNSLLKIHNDIMEKQNKEMNKASSGKGGKQSVNNLSQLQHFPGVKKVGKKTRGRT